MVAQLREISEGSSALLPDITAALGDLSQSVSSAVDLAVQVCQPDSYMSVRADLPQLAQRIGAHTAALRVSKEPLRLSDIEGFLVEITASSAAPTNMAPWDQIGMFISKLGAELGSILPKIRTAVKEGQVITGECSFLQLSGIKSLRLLVDISPPWLARVAAIKEAATHNVDTERKVVRMSEELKDLLREIKIRVSVLTSDFVSLLLIDPGSNPTRIWSQGRDPRAASGSN